MKTTIIYDNTVYQNGLRAERGFAALIEAKREIDPFRYRNIGFNPSFKYEKTRYISEGY